MNRLTFKSNIDSLYFLDIFIMRIDHCGLNIAMSDNLLHKDGVAVFLNNPRYGCMVQGVKLLIW